MAKYCNRCGAPLIDGQPCTCSENNFGGDNTIIENIKNRFNLTGAASPNDVYERGIPIVPDCITPDEGEIPLRQYNAAILRSRLKFERAEGRLQITNKRVLFRAKGTSLPGKTLLQYEFVTGELSGLEARSDYKFSLLNFFIGNFFISVGMAVIALLLFIARESEAVLSIFGYLFGLAGFIPFFILKRKWMWVKLMSLGASNLGLMTVAGIGAFGESKDTVVFGVILLVLCTILTIVALFLYMFVPNLVITFKTKGAIPSVDIRAKRRNGILAAVGLMRESEQDFTGFDECLPSTDTITAINEISAIINDLNTLGDMAIDKWKKM
jgi:hypothetical protein